MQTRRLPCTNHHTYSLRCCDPVIDTHHAVAKLANTFVNLLCGHRQGSDSTSRLQSDSHEVASAVWVGQPVSCRHRSAVP